MNRWMEWMEGVRWEVEMREKRKEKEIERERERERERKRLATTPRERRGNDVLNASRRPRRRRRWEGGRKGREGAKKNSLANIFVEGKGKIYPQPTPRIQKKTFKRSGSRVSALGDFFYRVLPSFPGSSWALREFSLNDQEML